MKNINFLQAGELHRGVGWQAALQDGPVSCTLRQTGGLHSGKLDCRNRKAGGLPFSAARCTAFLCSPLACTSVQPTESSRFSFENTAFQPARPSNN